MKNSKVKNKVKEIPVTIEQKYEDLLSLMKSMKCMKNTWSKVDMYSEIATIFTELGDYEEANKYAQENQKLASVTEEEIKINHYKKAENLRSVAKREKDYKEAAEEYRLASGYVDADVKASECEELSIQMGNKRMKNSLIKRGAGLLLLIVAITLSFFPFTRYYAANICMSVSSYSTAIKLYSGLGSYRESKEKILESHYMIGMKLEEEDNYKGAKKAYVAAKGFKDSDSKEVIMVKQILGMSEVGDIVTIGGCNWIILEKRDDATLLIKKAGIGGIPYHEIDIDITWESSTIRTYLNTQFIEKTFSDEERKIIIKTNVINNVTTRFGTNGGNNTMDDVFLLSTEEAEQYEDFLREFKNNSWLRSPGNSGNSAAFLMAEGIVMEYGYVISSDKFTLHPVLWFSIK